MEGRKEGRQSDAARPPTLLARGKRSEGMNLGIRERQEGGREVEVGREEERSDIARSLSLPSLISFAR